MNIPPMPRGYSVPDGRILTLTHCFNAQSRTEVLLCSLLMGAANSQKRFMQQPLRFLQDVNYYRLSAFFLPYERNLRGVPFSRIVRLYEFDSKLRALLIPLIEKVEIRFRSRIAYMFAERYGAEGYLESSSFSSRHDHETFIAHIQKCVKENRQSVVVKHHEEKYGGHYPLWVLIEFFSMGMLSYFFSDMKRADKKALVKSMDYNRSDKEIESWLRCLTILRNKCAHYSRLYYAVFTSVPLFDEGLDSSIARTLYPQLLMLKQLVQCNDTWIKFAESFSSLIDVYEDAIELKHMGLPDDWETKLSHVL